MRKKRLLLFDRDPAYAARFAAYGNQRESLRLEVIPFTDRGELERFLERQQADAALTVPEEEAFLRSRVSQVLVLSDQRPALGEPVLYRYQPCGQILQQAASLIFPGSVGTPEEPAAQIWGIYSPVHRCYKTTFALILGQLLAERGSALYLNLEEYAGFPALLEREYGETLSDLLYSRRVGEKDGSFPPGGWEYLGRLAYLPPVSCPADIREAPPEELSELIRALGTGGAFEFLVVDCGEALADPAPVLELCRKVYMPDLRDRASQAKGDAFLEYLRQMGREALVDRVHRLTLPYYPWLAGGCQDYRGLRWTAFGKYVEKLLEEEAECGYPKEIAGSRYGGTGSFGGDQ